MMRIAFIHQELLTFSHLFIFLKSGISTEIFDTLQFHLQLLFVQKLWAFKDTVVFLTFFFRLLRVNVASKNAFKWCTPWATGLGCIIMNLHCPIGLRRVEGRNFRGIWFPRWRGQNWRILKNLISQMSRFLVTHVGYFGILAIRKKCIIASVWFL